jgi:hypothetical protein
VTRIPTTVASARSPVAISFRVRRPPVGNSDSTASKRAIVRWYATRIATRGDAGGRITDNASRSLGHSRAALLTDLPRVERACLGHAAGRGIDRA